MNKFLSLEWFKAKIEHSIEKVIEKKINQFSEEIEKEEQEQEQLCPYKSIKLVNDVLVVVLQNGEVLTKSEFPSERFEDVCNVKTKSELLQLISTPVALEIKLKEQEESKKQDALVKGVELLKKLDDFIVNGNSVQLKGTSRTLPQLLVEKFIVIVDKYKNTPFENLQNVLNEDEEYQAHKNFFMWCCLNPRAEVADELYEFLENNSFRITKQGFFVALRNVVTLHGSKGLVDIVSNSYNKIKAVWKKNPADYFIFLENEEYKLVHKDKLTKEKTHTSTICQDCDGDGNWYYVSDDDNDDEDSIREDCETCNGTGEIEEYEYTINVDVNHGKLIGNLLELYLDLPNRAENRYTDNWTKTFDIRVGQVVNMPPEECSWSSASCAESGLHFAGHTAPYVLCGDTTVFTLHNPMKVVGIGTEKGRCYEYLPFMTTSVEEANAIMNSNDFDFLQLDEEYAIRELEALEEKAKEGFTIEAKKHEFNLPQISSAEIKNIVQSLSKMKEQIKNRVVNI